MYYIKSYFRSITIQAVVECFVSTLYLIYYLVNILKYRQFKHGIRVYFVILDIL